MWALALVLAGLPLEVETRPGEPVKVPLAQITLGSGTVRIIAGQTTFPAKVGFVLGAGDTLELGPDAWVTLALATNDHVVRLDDELTLKVEGLAMLKATKQTRSYKEQLDALVSPKEQEGALRLAGWHASAMAANVPQSSDGKEPSKKSEEAAPSKVLRQEGQSKPGAPRTGAPLGGNETEQKEQDESGGNNRKWSPPRDGPPKRESGSAKQNPTPSPTPTPPSPPPPPGSAMPMPPFVVDAALTACIESELKTWGPEVKRALGAALQLKARRREGVLQLRLGVGLVTPACVVAWVQQHQVTPEWQSLVVPLK